MYRCHWIKRYLTRESRQEDHGYTHTKHPLQMMQIPWKLDLMYIRIIFYNDFFEVYKSKTLEGQTAIKNALEITENSPYLLMTKRMPLFVE